MAKPEGEVEETEGLLEAWLARLMVGDKGRIPKDWKEGEPAEEGEFVCGKKRENVADILWAYLLSRKTKRPFF